MRKSRFYVDQLILMGLAEWISGDTARIVDPLEEKEAHSGFDQAWKMIPSGPTRIAVWQMPSLA